MKFDYNYALQPIGIALSMFKGYISLAKNNKQIKAAISAWKIQEKMRIDRMNRLGKRKIKNNWLLADTSYIYYSDIHSKYIRVAREIIKEYS